MAARKKSSKKATSRKATRARASGAGGKKRPEARMQACGTAKARWCGRELEKFQRNLNFLGVGLGFKEKDGAVLRNTPAVKFYVRRKKAIGELARNEVLNIAGTTTDVVEMVPLRARGPFTQRVRPGVGGSSGCTVVPGLNYTGTLGLGMRGYGALSDRTFVLSNNHVLANENQASVGDPVIQPGTLDGGNQTSDRIGRLYDYVPLRFEDPTSSAPPPVNQVDAACAEIDRFGTFSREIFWVGYPKGWRRRQSVADAVARGEDAVQKTGRTTGYTRGAINAIDFDGWVGYDTGDCWFEDQLLITPGSFSDAGDSGSCVLDTDENIVGLLFAGGATHTIANYIEDVWNLLPPIDFSDLPEA